MNSKGDFLRSHIEEVELSVHTFNTVKKAGLYGTVASLVQFSEADLLKKQNFGRKALNELKEVLEANGLHFGMSDAEVEGLLQDSILNHPTSEPAASLDPNDPLVRREDAEFFVGFLRLIGKPLPLSALIKALEISRSVS